MMGRLGFFVASALFTLMLLSPISLFAQTDSFEGVTYTLWGETFELVADTYRSKQMTVRQEWVVFGDLDRDGQRDAATVLSVNGGGSGTFYYLIVLTQQKTGLSHSHPFRQAAIASLGDRVVIRLIEIYRGTVVINKTGHASSDARCCPTEKMREEFIFWKNILWKKTLEQ